MDCNFKTAEGRFNFRVGAVIQRGGRLLGVHDRPGDEKFHYLPGGRVRINETMEEAMRREVREELGVDSRVLRPLWLRECFDDGDEPPYHGFEVYFLVELDWDALPSTDGPFERADTNGERHFFNWIEPGGYKGYIHPEFVRRSFPELPESFTLITDKVSGGARPGGDVKFPTEAGLFNFRAAGIFVHEGRLLAMTEPGIGHYYLPGGRVRINEAMEEALGREVREELGVGSRLARPLWLCESFFPLGGRQVHELAMYYLGELDWERLPALEGEFSLADSDGAEHCYRWLTEEEVKSARIYPIPMQECWPVLPEEFTLYSNGRIL